MKSCGGKRVGVGRNVLYIARWERLERNVGKNRTNGELKELREKCPR